MFIPAGPPLILPNDTTKRVRETSRSCGHHGGMFRCARRTVIDSGMLSRVSFSPTMDDTGYEALSVKYDRTARMLRNGQCCYGRGTKNYSVQYDERET